MAGSRQFPSPTNTLKMSTRRNAVFFGLIVLLTVLSRMQSNAEVTIPQAEAFLSKYGYLPTSIGNAANGALIDEATWKKALEEYQQFSGLKVTGNLDHATKRAMSLKRCGVADKIYGEDRPKRFVSSNSRMSYNNLTYRIHNYPYGLNATYNVDIEIARAFALWSKVTDLTFRKINNDTADINIRFVKGDHNDEAPFIADNILAHAHFPYTERRGEVHFNDYQKWNIGGKCGSNLFSVAAHEFGHVLGLRHSLDTSSLMGNSYDDKRQVLQLQRDDIMGIQFLYGKPKTQHKTLPGDKGGFNNNDDMNKFLTTHFRHHHNTVNEARNNMFKNF